jgi:tight adherence protein B
MFEFVFKTAVAIAAAALIREGLLPLGLIKIIRAKYESRRRAARGQLDLLCKGAGTLGVATVAALCPVSSAVLKYLIRLRTVKIADELPALIAVMESSIKAGLSISNAICLAEDGLCGPMRDEVHRMSSGLRSGSSVEEALESFERRVRCRDVFMFVHTVLVLKKSGGNIAEAFERLKDTARARHELKKKARAIMAQNRYQAFAISSMPWLLTISLQMTAPEYLRPLLSTRIGGAILAAAVLLNVCGIVAVRRITRVSQSAASFELAPSGAAPRNSFFRFCNRVGMYMKVRLPSYLHGLVKKCLARTGLEEVVSPHGLVVLSMLTVVAFEAAALSFHGRPSVVDAFGGIVFGLAVLCAWLWHKASVRRARLEVEVPFFLDMMALSMRAGQDFGDALTTFIEKAAGGGMRRELIRLRCDLISGQGRGSAFVSFARRTMLKGLVASAAIIAQCDLMGTGISDSLLGCASSMRSDSHEAMLLSSSKMSIAALLPLVLFIVPSVFLISFGPLAVGLAEGDFEALFR